MRNKLRIRTRVPRFGPHDVRDMALVLAITMGTLWLPELLRLWSATGQ